ncbi:MAG: TRAP transporter large permease, partial [Geminicoccaceae bacterium]
MDLLPVAVLFVLFAFNVPVAFAMAIAALSFFLFAAGPPIGIYVQRLVSATGSFPLLAVPFFILAGTIMNYAGITRRLMVFADALVGHWVGGLAQANIILATLMGGLSASANADAAMQAKMLGPEMVKRGYGAAFVAAVTACAAVITPIIPPGIGLIIYGFLADVSIGRLFIGGIVPGLLLCLALMATTYVIARRRDYRPSRRRFVSARELGRAFRDALWALTIPLFILVGIRFGIFTPTEAGAMTVIYAALIGFFAHRELKLRDLPAIILETVLATSTVMLIICAASAFGFYMAWERIPPQIAESLAALTRNPLLLLLLINLLLI